MTNNFGCPTATVVEYIIIVVCCVPTHDESFGSVTRLGSSASGEGPGVGRCELYNEPSGAVNAGNVVTI
jgi:hypothetical protein